MPGPAHKLAAARKASWGGARIRIAAALFGPPIGRRSPPNTDNIEEGI
ncbi:MAG TPA: hypothetical protein PL143_18545 [Rhodocyclaceae bacterium]|nr:hypothetical protein [Rhodocyclaceae bacterium]